MPTTKYRGCAGQNWTQLGGRSSFSDRFDATGWCASMAELPGTPLKTHLHTPRLGRACGRRVWCSEEKSELKTHRGRDSSRRRGALRAASGAGFAGPGISRPEWQSGGGGLLTPLSAGERLRTDQPWHESSHHRRRDFTNAATNGNAPHRVLLRYRALSRRLVTLLLIRVFGWLALDHPSHRPAYGHQCSPSPQPQTTIQTPRSPPVEHRRRHSPHHGDG